MPLAAAFRCRPGVPLVAPAPEPGVTVAEWAGLPRRVCCECGRTIAPGSEPPTHTYCPPCMLEYERRHGL